MNAIHQFTLPQPQAPATHPVASVEDDRKLRETFTQFVGETLFSQMLASMRKTQEKPAYFYGGRAEEVFQGQLDQVLSGKLASAAGDRFIGPMYELFQLQRQ